MPRQRESTVFQKARPGVRLDHLGPPQQLPSPQSSAASPSPAPTAARNLSAPAATPLLFAAGVGVGIKYHVPIVRDFLARHAASGSSARPKHYAWLRPANDHALSLSPCRGQRSVLFVTTPKSSNNNNNKEMHSPSATVRTVTGEPGVDISVEMESSRGGRLALWA